MTIPIPDENVRKQIAIPDSHAVTHTDTPTDTPTLTPTDKIELILSFCAVPRSRSEIQDYLGMKDKMYFFRVYLAPFIENDRLVMTIPDKPTSRNQKYMTKTPLSLNCLMFYITVCKKRN